MKLLFVLSSTVFAHLIVFRAYSQSNDTIVDFRDISPKLYNCTCYLNKDTVDYEFIRPLDNDYQMISAFNDHLINRFQINTLVYNFGISYTIYPEPKGDFLSDIWVEMSLYDYPEFEDLSIILPLCAIESLFRKEGTKSLNNEFSKLFDFSKQR